MSALPAEQSPGPRPQPAATPWNRLWQVPVFLAGLLALGAALGFRHNWRPSADEQDQKELKAAARALDEGDYRRAIALTRQALDRGGQGQQLSADLRFVLGSATYLDAEQLPADDRALAYRRARVYLQQAEQLGVSHAIKPRLEFRLALTQFCMGGDSDQVAAKVEQALADNPADGVEGYAFLTRLYLKKTPPDLESALRANERLLIQPALSNSNAARLQRGELLLELKRTDQARQVLERIPAVATEFSAARRLIAVSLTQDEAWQPAAELWLQVVESSPKADGWGEALCSLGECYLHLGRSAEAAQAWERVYRELPGSDEALAAAARLAQLRREEGSDDEAMAYYAVVLKNVPFQADSASADVALLRTWTEAALKHWLEAGKFDRVRQLAELYQRIASPGTAHLHFARASEAKGQAALKEAESLEAADAEPLRKDARRCLREAGDAYESAARQREREADRGDLLWSAAQCFLLAHDFPQVDTVLRAYAALEPPAPRRDEALVVRARAWLGLKQSGAAAELLKQVAAQAGPMQSRARYYLALAQLDLGNLDDADFNFREVLIAAAPDPAAVEYRQSRFELARLHYRRSQFPEAAFQLKKAIEQYPTDPQTLQARYLLADALRQAALQQTKNLSAAELGVTHQHYLQKRNEGLTEALAAFRDLAGALVDRQGTRPLGDEEELLLRRGRFGIGQCLFDLNKHPEAVDAYESFVKTYPNKAESLTALMESTRCHWRLKDNAKARATIARAEAVLNAVGDEELTLFRTNRKECQAWLDWAKEQSRDE